MDKRSIGVFDSGVGGLTALRELRKLLPGENFVYFGDTARVPYGVRSRETLLRFAREDIELLRSFDVKAVVVACGTVSATVLAQLKEEFSDLPLFGVVIPAAHEAVRIGGERIGLIGTEASVRSGAYEREIHALKDDAKIFTAACPKFVPLVESGCFRPEDEGVREAAEEYLSPLREKHVTSLVLGCTHYPLFEEVIGLTMGPEVTLIDTGAVCARAAVHALRSQDMLADREKGTCQYRVSGDAATFAKLAPIFLRAELDGQVLQTAAGENEPV